MVEDLVLVVYFCLVIPSIFLLGIFKGKSRLLFGFMLVGITIGLLASQINPIILKLSSKDFFYVTTNLTPLNEEILKAIPVLYFAFVISNKSDSILEVAFAVGIGFAIFENTTILLQNESANLLWILCRGVGAGLMHGVCTGAVGLGLNLAKVRKIMLLPGIFALLTLATIYHGIFNVLVSTEELKYFGICLPIVTYIPVVIYCIKYFNSHSGKSESQTASNN